MLRGDKSEATPRHRQVFRRLQRIVTVQAGWQPVGGRPSVVRLRDHGQRKLKASFRSKQCIGII